MSYKRLDEFKNNIYGKKVAVLGIGVSNIPAIEYLVKLGAKVTARDLKENLGPECDKLNELGIEFILGEKYLDNLEAYDYILRSPGIKPFEKGIQKAVEAGVILTSEIELLCDICPCKIVGVTGSDGKTTTTTLVAKFLEQAKYKVWLGGNIGIPLFSKLEEMKEEDVIVLELSSFQLMTMKKSVDYAIVTNITPNHLNYHRDYEEYIEAKEVMFKNQKEDDVLVLNVDNDITNRFIQKYSNRKNIRKFSNVDKVDRGVYLKNGNIVSNVNGKEEVISAIKEVKLVGIHNLANICAASACVVDLIGIEPIRDVVTTITGVEHRIEFVEEINGVKWYNDAIASTPTRTIAGLNSFKEKVILIAGGYDKNISYDVIGEPILSKVKVLILAGDTTLKIEKAVLDELIKQNKELKDRVEIVKFTNLEECVNYANSIAKDGDNVLMSPASASFDMYKNFEEKGKHFKELVRRLRN